MLEATRRQALLVCAPTQFSWCDAFFIEAINTPCVDEFVDFFRLVGNLCISFRDVDHFCAGQHRELVELAIGKSFFQTCCANTCKTFLENLGGDFGKSLLDEVAHKSRVRTMLKNCCRAAVAAPGFHHLAQ